MNMIQTHAFQQKDENDDQSSPNKHYTSGGSPVKTVMAALGKPRVSQEPLPQLHKAASKPKSKENVLPTKIEEVPFRRQDRRILNSRKQRTMDRKLIKCVLLLGILMTICGVAFFVLWLLFNQSQYLVEPLIIVGPMLVFCGVLFMLFTIEVCMRLQRNSSRVQDPEIDKITNLHHIKHWIEPELIPFGWGQEEDDGNDKNDDDRATVKGSVNGGNFQQMEDEAAANTMSDNPHLIMAAEMQKKHSDDDEAIPPDIFDESTRYSNVDRPSFSIDKSSPTPQRRGSFVPEEDRIANLFSAKSKR